MEHLKSTCSVVLPDGEPPEWIHLMPAEGALAAIDGRRWTLTDAAKVVEASLAASRGGLAIDYDHATDLVEKTGGPAPAAGWIKELQVRADGIWGRVEWTARASEMIRGKEYRHISPVFNHTRSGVVTRILRAALTNNPAFQLTALAHQQHEDHHSMEEFLKKLLAALGLPEDTAEDKALAHAAALTTQAEAGTALASVRKVLQLGDDADGSAIETALASAIAGQAEKPDPNAFVPRAEFDRVSKALASVQNTLAEDKATEAVEKAMEDGKIAPASKEWALGYARSDLDGFRAFCSAAPVVVAPGRKDRGDPPRKSEALTDAEKAMCSAMGLSEADFLKTRNEETAR